MTETKTTGKDAATRRVERQITAVFNELLESDPSWAPIFARFQGRQPRYRYFKFGNFMFGWTTETIAGKYQAFTYRPVGKGSRTPGKAQEWEPVDVVPCATRKRAKAIALARWHKGSVSLPGDS